MLVGLAANGFVRSLTAIPPSRGVSISAAECCRLLASVRIATGARSATKP